MDKKLKLTKLTKVTIANLQRVKGGSPCQICIYPFGDYVHNHNIGISNTVCKLP